VGLSRLCRFLLSYTLSTGRRSKTAKADGE
jgi:hypothetical protein